MIERQLDRHITGNFGEDMYEDPEVGLCDLDDPELLDDADALRAYELGWYD